MMNMTNNQVNTVVNNNMFRYIILEDEINYDYDDFELFGAVLYDTVDKKIVTTTYGHGVDMKKRACSIELYNFQDKEIMKEMISIMLDKTPITSEYVLENIVLCASENNPTAIPVNVIRGRKFKGFGYLVYAISSMSRFGTSIKPVVVDPTTGEVHMINSFSYIEYDKEFCNNFKNLVMSQLEVNRGTVRSLAHLWAYKMSYSGCDVKNYMDKVKGLGNTGAKVILIPEIVKLSIEFNIKKRELNNYIEKETLKKEKMPAIIEWVKNNTDKKTDEDIMKLAEHIFNKKY